VIVHTSVSLGNSAFLIIESIEISNSGHQSYFGGQGSYWCALFIEMDVIMDPTINKQVIVLQRVSVLSGTISYSFDSLLTLATYINKRKKCLNGKN
jgi:hypothetical protein